MDASCVTPSEFPNVGLATHSVGQLNFFDGGDEFICSGALLNTTTSSFTPYLLTANHCFTTQASATSLEVFWNYKTPVVRRRRAAARTAFPAPSGSTLLATSETSDFTFVQLSQDPPDGSVFLGWTTGDYAHEDGTELHRLEPSRRAAPVLHAPRGRRGSGNRLHRGARGQLHLFAGRARRDRARQLRLTRLPRAACEVVGQELGACGSNTDDDCDVASNLTVDGAFRVTFPSISRWLDPATPGPCVPNATTLCLHGGRFKVTTTWTRTNGDSGSGTGVTLTDDSAYFWFFSPDNVELVVKVLDACPNAQRFWVFAGGLTNVEVRMTVVDTDTGAVRIYDNPLGTAYVPLQDTNAFACP